MWKIFLFFFFFCIIILLQSNSSHAYNGLYKQDELNSDHIKLVSQWLAGSLVYTSYCLSKNPGIHNASEAYFVTYNLFMV